MPQKAPLAPELYRFPEQAPQLKGMSFGKQPQGAPELEEAPAPRVGRRGAEKPSEERAMQFPFECGAPDAQRMEINSNDLGESDGEAPALHFESKNSVNGSWKERRRSRSADSGEEKEGAPGLGSASKGKNFTFVQSEIDAEIAKNILYSDAGFQGHFNAGAPADEQPSPAFTRKFDGRAREAF